MPVRAASPPGGTLGGSSPTYDVGLVARVFFSKEQLLKSGRA